MEKKTLLAVILSVVVITIGFWLQSVIWPREEVVVQPSIPQAAESVGEGQETTAPRAAESIEKSLVETSIKEGEDEPEVREIAVSNNVFDVVLSTRGAIVTSVRLKEHLDNGVPLEMIKLDGTDRGAFIISFGGPYDPPVNEVFHYLRVDSYTHVFYRDFKAPENGNPFTLRKTYTFAPDDYMVELKVSIENSINEYPNLNFDGIAYTLGFGPQIGPEFEKLDGRYDFRKFMTYHNGKRHNIKIKNELGYPDSDRINWCALAGKYFTVVAIPDATPYRITFSTEEVFGIDNAAQMFFSRPIIKSSKNEDVFRFYIGPKTNRDLGAFDKAEDNGFGLRDMNLEEVMDTGNFFGWLEWILKQLLTFFYSIIHNYGVAIILLTIFIKIIFFPITHKSYESTSKMQALNPKIAEIKAKYKDNPNKMNQAMAALYKKEKVNPLGGCLPLLLQMPIFIALYGLLNKYFELRGAVFLPGWITDLSAPDSVLHLANFSLPFLGWSDLRMLPILMVGTQILSSKLMQTPEQSGSGKQMKMMMYMMPIMFFFMLYNAPSGLLLYWTITNLLTALQQMFISRRMKKKKA